MMSIELYLVFVVASALLVATPGPNVALIVGTSLTHGARTGLTAVAGVNVGVVIQLAVVAARPVVDRRPVCPALRRDPLHRRGLSAVPRHPDLVEGAQAVRRRRRFRRERAFARGFAVAFANPKTLIFQAAFLPQFLSNGAGRSAQLWLLAATFGIHRGGRRCALGARRGAAARRCRAGCNCSPTASPAGS